MAVSAEAKKIFSDATFHPLWLDNPAAPLPEPPLIGAVETDLLIVGGGFTGLWAAVQAKEKNPQREIVLIEAKSIPGGASGRPCALFSTSVFHGLGNAVRTFPNDVEAIEDIGRKNFEEFSATLKRHNIDAEAEWNGELTVAVGNKHNAEVKEEFELHKKYGHDIELLDQQETQQTLNSPLFTSSMHTKSKCGVLHPAKLCWGLKATAIRLGVKVYEYSPLEKMQRSGAKMVIKTHSGVVSARKVLLATNAFAAGHKDIKQRVSAIRDRIVATEPLSDEQIDRLNWHGRQSAFDTRTQLNYMRLTKDNRMLFGGRLGYYFNNNTDPSDDREVDVYHRLANTFLTTFPQLDDIKISHAWGGPIGLTTRMGVHFQQYYDGDVIYAGGYSGFGVSATRFGSRLGLAILDDEKIPELDLDLAKIKPNWIPPEPFRWIGAKLTMHALDDVDEKGGWRKAWIKMVRAMGFPLY